MKIISRIDAELAGNKHYNTGKKCRHGHSSNRYTANGACVECAVSRESEMRKTWKTFDEKTIILIKKLGLLLNKPESDVLQYLVKKEAKEYGLIESR